MSCDKQYITGANPYMPLWEHVPDGEPRVFEYNGEKRMYIYGSHEPDNEECCGRDYVVWSAPVNDLTNWMYHGVSYRGTDGKLMYAPDVVQKGDTFYLYAAEDCGKRIMLAKSKNPAGPFENPELTELGFDPGVLVDDDGRVYAYWGGFMEGSHCAELNDDMRTIKQETLCLTPITGYKDIWAEYDDSFADCDGFFEASSMRKIFGKYVYVYSKLHKKPLPDSGVGKDCYGYLSYMYSDHPLTGFVKGGDISLNAGEIITLPDGTKKSTYPWGNNHGGLAEVNGQWYIFYHRHTGTQIGGRQAMVEPVDIAMDEQGRVFIGDITYVDGQPVSSKPVEMTSQGAMINGIDAFKIISAGYACHISGSEGAYIESLTEPSENLSTKIRNISSGTIVGFRYLQFGTCPPKTLSIAADALADIKIRVHLDWHDGKIVAEANIPKGETQTEVALQSGIIGKHAVYFEFIGAQEDTIAAFDKFTFNC